MPPEGEPAARREDPGLLAGLRRLGATLVATFHSRVELAALELELERARLTRLVLLGVGALFFLALGAFTLTFFVIALFWDSHRLLAIGLLTALYFGIGIGFALHARSEASRATRPFAASVAQIKADRDHLAGD